MTQSQAALPIVRTFLETYYFGQPDNDLAAARAVREYSGHFGRQYETASAFRHLFEAGLPAGTLQELVEFAADRMVVDDDEAREFLTMVYADNLFQLVTEFDKDDLD